MNASEKLLEQMLAWVEAEEGRSLTLFPGRGDFDEGPDHLLEFTIGYGEAQHVFGATREECFRQILARTTAGA